MLYLGLMSYRVLEKRQSASACSSALKNGVRFIIFFPMSSRYVPERADIMTFSMFAKELGLSEFKLLIFRGLTC